MRIVSEVDAQVICAGCGSNGTDFVFPSTQQVYPVEFSGSGAFISADGYLLTAFHVVDLSCSDNESSILQYWQSDVQTNYQNYGFSSADAATQFAQSELNANLLSVQCQNSSYSEVFPSNAYTGNLTSAGALIGYKVTQIVQSSPVDQQDTAIIKVDVPQDMPYLALASASDVQTGENLTAIAYPGDADQTTFGVLLDPTQSNADVNTLDSLLTPSIDSGQVTATQTLSDGTLTYETSGVAYHGSSGGPAVDDQGRIIGFFDTFTPASQQSQRVSVMIASSVAATYAKQAGLATPRAGTVEPLWTKAMNDYYGSGPCHFGNAYSDLTQLRTLHPEFAGAQSFFANAQQKQTPSACAASLQHGPSALLVLLLVLIVLVLLAAALYFLVLRRRRAPEPAMVGITPAGMPASASSTWPGATSGGTGYGQLSGPSEGQATMPGSFTSTPGPYTPMPGSFTPAPGPITPAPGPMNPAPGATVPPVPTSFAPPPAPATPSAAGASALGAPPATGPRMCANGHVVYDATGHFCPECGAPLQNPATPA